MYGFQTRERDKLQEHQLLACQSLQITSINSFFTLFECSVSNFALSEIYFVKEETLFQRNFLYISTRYEELIDKYFLDFFANSPVRVALFLRRRSVAGY